MLRKSLIIMLLAVFALPIAEIKPAQAEGTSEVCGLDGKNYDNTAAAEAAGVDVAYNFACTNPSSEAGLYESAVDDNFAGMLVEVGSTDVPTNLIVRSNKDGQDYTVAVSASTTLGQRKSEVTSLSDWIPGDQIRVIGKKNENTGNVDATLLANLSINMRINKGANGWITKIDKDAKKITYQWANKEYVFAYDNNTRFVVGLKNQASVDDLKINDRIRGRLLERSGQDPLAKIVVVLRRGQNLFMKIRTFTPRAALVRLDSTVVPTTIQVKIEKTPGLKANDINNLIGQEGSLVTVNITEKTALVRKYFGKTTLSEFSIGDSLMIVGRVNDDGTVDAKLVKNNDIWRTVVRGYAGTVKEVNAAGKYLMVEWTPIRYLTRNRLEIKLREKGAEVKTQANSNASIKGAISQKITSRVNRIKQVIINQFSNIEKRDVKFKKVVISRISHSNVELGDLISRGEPRTVKVFVDDDTKIIIGTNREADLKDVKVGDKIRIRGVISSANNAITADKIAVVSALPEIDEPLAIALNEVNEVVSEIAMTDSSSIVQDTTTATEQEIEND